MSIETILPWVQLVLGALFFVTGYASWRAGRPGGRHQIILGVMSAGVGVSMWTSGWPLYATRIVLAICSVFVIRTFLTRRDRATLLAGLLFFAFTAFISMTELLVDDLSPLEQASFALVAVVALAVVVTTGVRLVMAVRQRHA